MARPNKLKIGLSFFRYPTPQRCAAAQPRILRAPAEAARHGISQSRITFVPSRAQVRSRCPNPTADNETLLLFSSGVGNSNGTSGHVGAQNSSLSKVLGWNWNLEQPIATGTHNSEPLGGGWQPLPTAFADPHDAADDTAARMRAARR
jgi:hypothetical protein